MSDFAGFKNIYMFIYIFFLHNYLCSANQFGGGGVKALVECPAKNAFFPFFYVLPNTDTF